MQTASKPRKPAATPESASVSMFRNLYTRVLLGLQENQYQIIGVTSAIAGEGKTTVAAGLAAALAEDGALLGFGRNADTALLVQSNTGSSPEDPRLDVPSGPGLIEYLRGKCTLDAAIYPSGVSRLSILPAGEPLHTFPLAIRSGALAEMITDLKTKFGLIVLDLPPVLNSSDTQVLARLADQLVVVVRSGVTPAKLVQQALGQFEKEQLLGVVLNDSQVYLPSWLEHRL